MKIIWQNPINAATNVNIIIDIKVLVTFKKKYPVTALVDKAIIATPVANPSNPSIKLTALVIAKSILVLLVNLTTLKLLYLKMAM